jgi:transcription-repair coupling factor (superfamily II helicase)
MELGRDRVVHEIISRLKDARGNEGAVKVEGTWGSFAPLLAAYASKELSRPILYLRPHIDDADKAADDLHTFGAEDVNVFAAWEGEEDLADATDETRAERLKLVARLSSLVARDLRAKTPVIIAASVQALCQPIPKPQALEASSLSLEVGRKLSPEEAVRWLIDNGFERTDGVDLPGQFAHRGGIVDIYAPLVEITAGRSGG